MELNFKKFQKEINKRKSYSDDDYTGINNVIRIVWNLSYIQDINFDSFTYEDVIDALEIFQESPVEYENWDETFLLDPNNPFVKHHEIERALSNLFRAKRSYQTEKDEDIFI